MAHFIRSNSGPLGALCTLIVIVLAAILITVFTAGSRPHVVRLGKAASAYRAPSTGGGISVPRYFVRALRHHAWCGAPTTQAKRGIHGVFRQYFHHCQMAIGPVKVYGLPLPERTVIGAVVGGTPTAVPGPTYLATPWWTAIPIPVPNQYPTPAPVSADHTASCKQGSSTECVLMLVDLINAERSQHGIAPLSYSWLLTNGTGTCVGAIGHATHMANDLHTIAHDQFPADVCAGSTMGENVGVSAYGSLYADAMQIHTGMMTGPNEVYTPGCSGNHHCDWMDPNHTYVGIAFVAGTFQGLPAHYESEEYSNAG